jgi:acyl-CoA thioesterase-1
MAALVAAAIAAGAACHRAPTKAAPAAQSAQAPKGLPGLETDPPARPKVVCLGDSITAGLGVFQVEAYPALLEKAWQTEGYNFEVVNAGESGDTSATALRRLDWVLDAHTKILIVAVGGNDALRGIAPAATHDNIAQIITTARAKGVDVLLAGMEAPPNLGDDYTAAFRGVFAKLAKEQPVSFYPFLLKGVAGDPKLNQADGIHPTPEGHVIIADQLYDVLKPMLDDVENRVGVGG